VKPRASKTVLVKRGRPKYTKPARSTKMVKAKKPNRVRVIKKR